MYGCLLTNCLTVKVKLVTQDEASEALRFLNPTSLSLNLFELDFDSANKLNNDKSVWAFCAVITLNWVRSVCVACVLINRCHTHNRMLNYNTSSVQGRQSVILPYILDL